MRKLLLLMSATIGTIATLSGQTNNSSNPVNNINEPGEIVAWQQRGGDFQIQQVVSRGGRGGSVVNVNFDLTNSEMRSGRGSSPLNLASSGNKFEMRGSRGRGGDFNLINNQPKQSNRNDEMVQGQQERGAKEKEVIVFENQSDAKGISINAPKINLPKLSLAKESGTKKHKSGLEKDFLKKHLWSKFHRLLGKLRRKKRRRFLFSNACFIF